MPKINELGREFFASHATEMIELFMRDTSQQSISELSALFDMFNEQGVPENMRDVCTELLHAQARLVNAQADIVALRNAFLRECFIDINDDLAVHEVDLDKTPVISDDEPVVEVDRHYSEVDNTIGESDEEALVSTVNEGKATGKGNTDTDKPVSKIFDEKPRSHDFAQEKPVSHSERDDAARIVSQASWQRGRQQFFAQEETADESVVDGVEEDIEEEFDDDTEDEDVSSSDDDEPDFRPDMSSLDSHLDEGRPLSDEEMQLVSEDITSQLRVENPQYATPGQIDAYDPASDESMDDVDGEIDEEAIEIEEMPDDWQADDE